MLTTSHIESSEVAAAYGRADERIRRARQVSERPLRLADKLLLTHLADNDVASYIEGATSLTLYPDRLAMPDSSAQTALLQFIAAQRETVALPTTLHCDHLIRAERGRELDLLQGQADNAEVYDFLESAAAKYGIGLWGPGSGIIHQVILERYAFPGGMLLGADSHTPNAGGLAMLAIGAGGAQAVDLMVGLPIELPRQKVIGVQLTGRLHGYTSAKDIILRVATHLTVSGGTGAIIEYFGDGANTLSATGKATICNMGAEIGATTSVFGYDDAMGRYLRATDRSQIAEMADARRAELIADPGATADPSAHYDEYLHIDLDTLEPQIVGPHSPDRGRDLSGLADEAREQSWPIDISQALVGSCTNSSYEDMGRAAHIARQAAAAGLKVTAPLLITPGSETIRATIERDGILDDLEAIGAQVLANACGPCIGQWARSDVTAGETNTIVTSFNRNFPGRNDGSAQTLAFIGSPEIVVGLALAGRLDFDMVHDTLSTPDGRQVRFEPPVADELPTSGFADGTEAYRPPAERDVAADVVVKIRESSERLQLLEPFKPWDQDAYTALPILVKVVGKCTTDHISPAGKWLTYRGHLDRISDNTFIGANNAFTDAPGTGIDQLDNTQKGLADIARHYKANNLPWVAIGDENYGEGSSREHAAMQPRHLGALAVIAKSYARIHETNLKKHGVLPLRFMAPEDHDRLGPSDRLDVTGLDELAPGRDVDVWVRPQDAEAWLLKCQHSLNEEQIAWFRAGSALNALASAS